MLFAKFGSFPFSHKQRLLLLTGRKVGRKLLFVCSQVSAIDRIDRSSVTEQTEIHKNNSQENKKKWRERKERLSAEEKINVGFQGEQ
jgi:hypothetical protein